MNATIATYLAGNWNTLQRRTAHFFADSIDNSTLKHGTEIYDCDGSLANDVQWSTSLGFPIMSCGGKRLTKRAVFMLAEATEIMLKYQRWLEYVPTPGEVTEIMTNKFRPPPRDDAEAKIRWLLYINPRIVYALQRPFLLKQKQVGVTSDRKNLGFVYELHVNFPIFWGVNIPDSLPQNQNVQLQSMQRYEPARANKTSKSSSGNWHHLSVGQ